MTTIEEALEGSTPLGTKLKAAAPRASPAQLVAAMRRLLPTLTESEAIETLNAHPPIGEGPQRLSRRSRQEQGEDKMPHLHTLNAEYERRFGFRFVVFVNGRSKSEILEVLRQRLGRSREEEMAAGLAAIVDIAEDRMRS